MRFKPGVSGNPKGRPPRKARTREQWKSEVRGILTPAEMRKVLRMLREQAQAGCTIAAKLCLEYAYGKPVQPTEGQLEVNVNTGEHQLSQMFQLQALDDNGRMSDTVTMPDVPPDICDGTDRLEGSK